LYNYRHKIILAARGLVKITQFKVSQFDEGLWQQWPSPSAEICFGILQPCFMLRNLYYSIKAISLKGV